MKWNLGIDHFLHKIFCKIDECGDHFETLAKKVKCSLVLDHSNADVERSLSINKRMLTKENTVMNDETLIGLRAI